MELINREEEKVQELSAEKMKIKGLEWCKKQFIWSIIIWITVLITELTRVITSGFNILKDSLN